MKIIEKYASNNSLSNKERAENRLALPDSMSLADIAGLWHEKQAMQEALMRAMFNAYQAGVLIGYEQEILYPWQGVLYVNGGFLSPVHGGIILMTQGYNPDIMVRKDDFSAWLAHENQKLPEQCLLKVWLKSQKPEKKRMHMKRGRTQSLEFIDGLLDHYKVEYLSDLSAQKAWGFIVSGEYQNDLIKKIDYENKRKIKILLKDGETLTCIDFSEKYRKRFEPEIKPEITEIGPFKPTQD